MALKSLLSSRSHLFAASCCTLAVVSVFGNSSMAAWPPSGVNWSTILLELLASAQLSYRLPIEDVPALAAPKLSMIEEMSSPPHSLVVVLRCSLPML